MRKTNLTAVRGRMLSLRLSRCSEHLTSGMQVSKSITIGQCFGSPKNYRPFTDSKAYMQIFHAVPVLDLPNVTVSGDLYRN